MYKKGQSVEDLAKLMRSIEDEDLTLTGRDKQRQRRSAMRGAEGGEDPLPEEQVNKIKKMTSLKRTLKVRILMTFFPSYWACHSCQFDCSYINLFMVLLS